MCKFVRKHFDLYKKRKDITTYTLRHGDRLMLPTSRITMHSDSPFVMSIKLYNKLPTEIKNEAKLNKFTQQVKKFLCEKCYYTVNEYLNDNLKNYKLNNNNL